jgi:hypothetical protein
MESNFVPYQIALDMKSIEFDEPCFGYYTGDKMHLVIRPAMSRTNIPDSYVVTAPLYQQCFRWFREKYNLAVYIQYYADWNFEIFRIDDKIAEVQDDVNVDYTFKGGTYEEAELECLKKLIEIVKKKQC